jgi:alpha-D-xyloside xylohydrolase
VSLATVESGVVVQLGLETLRVEAWGRDTVRVQSAIEGVFGPVNDALIARAATPAKVTLERDSAQLEIGRLRVVVTGEGHLSFYVGGDDHPILREPVPERLSGILNGKGRRFERVEDDAYAVTATFESDGNERFYGLGQQQVGRLNLKGCVLTLEQRNGQVSIPVLVSSRGYGIFWNSPSVGRVELATNRTRWVADRARQLDYFVYVGDGPAGIVARYCELTGFPTPLPDWASGFWQSKTRYRSQDELLSVAREYWRRGLPLSVILADFYHWNYLGDWDWDLSEWPDPRAMVEELASHGCHLMVSIWPHVNPRSHNFERLRDAGLLVTRPDGSLATFHFADKGDMGGLDLALYDATNPAARAVLWEAVKRNHYDIGVRAFWVDACEPETTGDDLLPLQSQARYHRGHGTAVSSLFPFLHAEGLRDGLAAAGDGDSLLMARSGWAGSQRLGVALWSGDTLSSWEVLRGQVTAGLNTMVSGIPWWNSDIGGFFGADIADDGFRELLIRWFQFAVFCPIMRLHGLRGLHYSADAFTDCGDDNEVWSFGERAYAIVRGLLFLRERLRPYIRDQVLLASGTGMPPMRPLWFEDPHDPVGVLVEDQFMFGPDLLVAPVLEAGVSSRRLYLPRGAEWRNPWAGSVHPGGTWVTVSAPLEVVPIMVREGSALEVGPGWLDRSEDAGPR